MRAIQPSLKIFLNLPKVYSSVGAHTYRIIPDLHEFIQRLQEIHAHPSVADARQQSSENAIAKISKYLDRFSDNNWVCAALALDPPNRWDMLFGEYEMDEQSADDVVA
jgi:hypothetical protein